MKIVAAFPYRSAYNLVVGRLLEPVIPIVLSHGHHDFRQSILIDSGADISLIPATLGVALGLEDNMSARAQARGLISEHAPLRIVEVHIQIGESTMVPIRAGWLEDDNVPPLLGRLDVFDHFTFEFNHERRMVIVRQ